MKTLHTTKDVYGTIAAQSLYDMAAGNYCGVYMPERVMRKVQRLQADYMAAVQRVLSDHAEELLVSDWTLANHEDEAGKILEQRIIRYAIPGDDVQQRIALFRAQPPQHFDKVYIVKSRDEARAIAQAVLDDVVKGVL